MFFWIVFILLLVITLLYLFWLFKRYNQSHSLARSLKIVSIVMMALTLIAGGLALTLGQPSEPSVTKKSPSPAQTSDSLYSESSNNQSTPPLSDSESKPSLAIGDLQATIENILTKDNMHVGISILDKDGHSIVDINSNELFETASTYKPLLTASTLNSFENNDPTLTSIYGSDAKSIIKQMLEPVITYSDNTNAVEIGNNYGWEKVNADMVDLGIDSFHINVDSDYTLYIQPQDMAKFYYLLNNGQLMNNEDTDYLLNLLSQSEEPTDFDEYMPEGYTYQNKYGNLDYVYHDTGILTTASGETYYLAIYTDNWENTNGQYDIQSLYQDLAETIMAAL